MGMVMFFMVPDGAVLRQLELLLVVAVLFLFVGRLMVVSAYQRRTGDLFDIKLLAWYHVTDTGGALEKRRMRVIASANLLAKIMWLCSTLLGLLYMAGHYLY